MATTPLFVPDYATLKERLRLSGVPSGVDADELIGNALLEVRIGFFRRLGETRVAELVGFPVTDNPSTENEVLRSLAGTVEVKWTRHRLLCVLPTLFMDGSNNRLQIWNDEGVFRSLAFEELQWLKHRLEQEIEQDNQTLEEGLNPGEEVSINADVIGPETPPPAPFSTLNPRW